MKSVMMVYCMLTQYCCYSIKWVFLFSEQNHWSLVSAKGSLPCPRRRQCCCKIDNKVYLFGGTRFVYSSKL